jgi:chemotaxis protein MotB
MSHMRPLAFAVAALAAFALSGCSGDERELGYKDVEIDEYQRQIKELEDQLYKKDESGVKGKIAQNGSASTSNIQNQVGPDVDVSTQPVEVVMSIDSEVLFKSGSAQLSAQAKSALNKVVATINAQFPNHDVKVVGHTDDQKITRSKGTWNDNWDLSAGRAREVLLYLEGRGIQAKRLGLAGYADQRPKLANSSSENKAKNRRVEIVVVPTAK